MFFVGNCIQREIVNENFLYQTYNVVERRDAWVWLENRRKINSYVFIRAVEAVNVVCGKLYSEGNSK